MKDKNKLASKLETISAISVVPFQSDLSVDYDGVARNLDYLVEKGISVVVVGGNTGEFSSLTAEENSRLVDLATHRIGDAVMVIAGVGNDLASAIKAAKHAEASGVSAIMIHQTNGPFHTQQGYYEYNLRVAEAVGIGVIPYVRSATVEVDTLLQLVELPNLIGVKYAVNNLQAFGALVMATQDRDDFRWICGTAESWAPTFYAMGAQGFTSGLVNVAPEFSLRMLKALQAQDYAEARRVWLAIKPFEDLRARRTSELNVPVVKEAMEQMGLGSRRVRPPLSELAAVDCQKVSHFIQSIQ